MMKKIIKLIMLIIIVLSGINKIYSTELNRVYNADEISKYTNNIILVNKDFPIKYNIFYQENPIAKKELLNLIADAQKLNLNISKIYSGYRSYDKQKSLYESYVEIHGVEEANLFSAKPNHSEHQTGLAFDLLDNNGQLIEQEIEAKWIEENCANYGFIVRYPKGKEAITKYQYEPWHLRYVGKEHAKNIMENKITLEEYILKK